MQALVRFLDWPNVYADPEYFEVVVTDCATDTWNAFKWSSNSDTFLDEIVLLDG